MTKVKICGVTRSEDLEAVVDAGADFVGINLWPGSSRRVLPEIARGLCEAASATKTHPVALVVDPTPDDLARAGDLGFSTIQVHGPYDPSHLPAGARVIRAVEIEGDSDLARAENSPEEILLLDARVPGRRGGTGRTFDWSLAARLAPRRRILLAGGLTPENVAEAVRTVRPWGVDAASGVETSPGVKDPAKVRAFVASARSAA